MEFWVTGEAGNKMDHKTGGETMKAQTHTMTHVEVDRRAPQKR